MAASIFTPCPVPSDPPAYGTARSVPVSRSFLFMGALLTIHADSADTNGQSALVEAEGGPGAEPPMHVHENEDELFYVIEGQLKVFCGDRIRILNAGESGFLPRRVPHTFEMLSKRARFLVYITPGGFEEYFREVGEPASEVVGSVPPAPCDMETRVRAAARHNISFPALSGLI
jgi:mannose-6-phosphate isomerase-like protein (cupin superfamily)